MSYRKKRVYDGGGELVQRKEQVARLEDEVTIAFQSPLPP